MNAESGAYITTVLGAAPASNFGMTDAHQHVWIDRVIGIDPSAPVLEDLSVVREGLVRYKAVGGAALLDCQPDGCGRNVAVLSALAQNSGVAIIACTGFHLRQYYPPDHWLWSANESDAGDYFIRELRDGASESPAGGAIRAGFIKIACSGDLKEPPPRMLAAAATASALTGAALLVHTDQGALAEEILQRLLRFGAEPSRIVLCHMDKRPDPELHKTLAATGVLLEYDTFFRPKYDPERNVWPLVEQMLTEGQAGAIAFGTDLADVESWRNPGPAGLPSILAPRLVAMGCAPDVVAALTGNNIVARLAISRRAGARANYQLPL